MSIAPPPVIDCARVLAYAHVADDVPCTGAIHLDVDGELLGRVPNLAICRNYYKPDDILLLFCDAAWESKGCIAFTSVAEAQLKAEKGYTGISSHWHDSPYDDDAVTNFLRDEYEVDPNSQWWFYRCSFCKREVEVSGITKGWATICRTCVDEFHSAMRSDGV